MNVKRKSGSSQTISDRSIFGYCTNVHPGVSLDQIKQNLERESLDVKRQVSPDQPMGIGLWLSSTATQELMDRDTRIQFRDWLQTRDLVPYTVNAFPAGDFHQKVVKHDVYKPTWADKSRLDYTCRVATILTDLLPRGASGTISTLPLAWPLPTNDEDQTLDGNSISFLTTCATHLTLAATFLADLAEKHDVLLRLCIEPEPGCLLDRAQDVVGYFRRYFFEADQHAGSLPLIQRHLGVCHDICHSAVMFEPQALALDQYAEADIAIGKVQVSSAIEVDFDSLDATTAAQTFSQLAQFAEPKYLHQTSIRTDDSVQHFSDLPLALNSVDPSKPNGKWRVHFHVPIHESTLGLIHSTQSQILECIKWFKNSANSGQPDCHFEVETYAWNVLPEPLQPARLADGIAAEMNWFLDRFNN